MERVYKRERVHGHGHAWRGWLIAWEPRELPELVPAMRRRERRRGNEQSTPVAGYLALQIACTPFFSVSLQAL